MHDTHGIPQFHADLTSFFLTGTSRSGTELLRQILNRHPAVYISAETHYFAELRPRCEQETDENAHARAVEAFAELRGSAYGLGGNEAKLPKQKREEDLRRTAGTNSTPDELFLAHCTLGAADADKTEATLWGEKCPRHIFHVKQILDVFPNARIVFMLRDPCAVAASYMDWTNHWYDGRSTTPALAASLSSETRRVQQMDTLVLSALMWRGAVMQAQRMQAIFGPERIRIQSFEELLLAPEKEIPDLCEFLNVPMDNRMLRVPRVNSSYKPAGQKEELDRQAVSAWKNRMSDKQVWWMRRLTASIAEPLGYEPALRGPYPFFAALDIGRTFCKLPKILVRNLHRKPQYIRRFLAAIR
jgi:hypothetical protein